MLELDEYKFEYSKFATPLEEVGQSLDIEGKKARIAALEKSMEEPGFWDDIEGSGKVMKELKNLKDNIEEFKTISSEYDDIGAMIEMAEDEPGDEELVTEAGEMLEAFKKKFEAFRVETLLSGEFDECNAVVSLHAGAGGTESCAHL